MAETVHCYNKGCGQKFDPSNNQEGKKKIIRMYLISQWEKGDLIRFD